MASQDVWADFETLRHNLRYYKVDHLKQIVVGFNEECSSNLTKSGKKQDLIDRIHNELQDWKKRGLVDRWMKGKAIAYRVRQTGTYSASSNGNVPSTARSYPNLDEAVPYRPGQALPRYDPYAPARQASASTSSFSVPPAQQPPMPIIRFKYSPFFKVERLASSIAECPESTTSMDRRSQSLTFVMTNDMLAKLNSNSPKYQLRLYCTSSTYYTPPTPTGFRSPGSTPCPIEFPPTCEVRVNGTQLNANLKGLKKKPGTAPPPDLGKVVRMAASSTNRVEMIYVNSQQPTPPKKYYLVVALVEVTTVDQLIDRLRKGKYKQREDILAEMNKSVSDDDDIIAGHQKMSLKCPLSYMRITTPCRSAVCVHPQCFDALSWFSVMEQTTTWMCPVCEKVLNVEDLIIDGYFDDILKHTPEDVEDVIVEADGQWHTEDNKYGSPEWKAAHPLPPPPKPVVPVRRAPSPAKPATNGVNGAARGSTPIEISDSEDEDEGRVKRELSPSTDGLLPRPARSTNSSQAVRSQVPDVIDLTLSDDEEPPPAPPPPPHRPPALPVPASPAVPPKKRKETDDPPSPTEQIWKKSRTDSSASPSSAFNDLVNNSTLRMPDEAANRRLAPIPSASSSRFSSSSQPYRAPSSGSQHFGPSGSFPPLPPPASLPRRPSTSSQDFRNNTLPPLPPYVTQRGSGAGSSSPHHWR
ncbi:PINIT domain-containing protein [Earliella scabrosa]|nr:PINIT domain-containing protein [Earliella scabrosa]